MSNKPKWMTRGRINWMARYNEAIKHAERKEFNNDFPSPTDSIPTKPKADETVLFFTTDEEKKNNWKIDGHSWRQNSTYSLPKSAEEKTHTFIQYYYKNQNGYDKRFKKIVIGPLAQRNPLQFKTNTLLMIVYSGINITDEMTAESIESGTPPTTKMSETNGKTHEETNEKTTMSIATPSTDLLRAMGKFQRVLVTGGAGFLGRHLCRRLIRDGHEVICLDNFFTSQKKDVEDLVGHKNFELVRHDVTNPMQFEVDQIYNLACPASPVHYQYNPIKTCKTSFMGAMNCLGLAKRVKARVLQASTSEVYGDPDRSPQEESYWGNVNPIGVRACYDEGKRVAETLFFSYHNQNSVDIRVVRIFNTYGPGMHPFDGRVVSNFIMQALRDEDITIYGDGSQTRSFCYVDDLVEAMVRMMAQEDEIGPVNIGNPNEFTIKELAEAVLSLIPESKSEIKYLPLPGDDPKQRKPNIEKARSVIGWEPKLQLQEGLSQTIAYFKNLDMSRYKKPTMHTAHENTEKHNKKRKLSSDNESSC